MLAWVAFFLAGGLPLQPPHQPPRKTARYERSFHAIGVGMPRTGQTYLAEMLAPVVRTRCTFKSNRHVGDVTSVRMALLMSDCGIGKDGYLAADVNVKCKLLDEYIVRLNSSDAVDFEASALNTVVQRRLQKIYPTAKFIHLVRDPWTWLRSFYFWQLRGGNAYLKTYFEDWFGPSPATDAFPDAEKKLVEKLRKKDPMAQWWPIELLVKRWVSDMEKAKESNSSIVVHTYALDTPSSRHRIAYYLGIDEAKLGHPQIDEEDAQLLDSFKDMVDPPYIDKIVQTLAWTYLSSFGATRYRDSLTLKQKKL